MIVHSHIAPPKAVERYARDRFGSTWTADYSAHLRERWWRKDYRPNRQAAIDEWRRMTKLRASAKKPIDRAASLALTPECIEAVFDALEFAMGVGLPILSMPTFLTTLPDAILHCYASAYTAAMAIEFHTGLPCVVMFGSITQALDPQVVIQAGEYSPDSNPLCVPIALNDGFMPVPLSGEHAEAYIELMDRDDPTSLPSSLVGPIHQDITAKLVGMSNMNPAEATMHAARGIQLHGVRCCIYNYSLGAKSDLADLSYPLPILVVGSEKRGDGYMIDVCGDLTIRANQPKTHDACGQPRILTNELSASPHSSTLFSLSMTQTPLMISQFGYDTQWLGIMPLLSSFRQPLWSELKEGVTA